VVGCSAWEKSVWLSATASPSSRLLAPERRNALTVAMARELVDAAAAVDADGSVGAAVIRGEGGHFCAGAHRDALRRRA